MVVQKVFHWMLRLSGQHHMEFQGLFWCLSKVFLPIREDITSIMSFLIGQVHAKHDQRQRQMQAQAADIPWCHTVYISHKCFAGDMLAYLMRWCNRIMCLINICPRHMRAICRCLCKLSPMHHRFLMTTARQETTGPTYSFQNKMAAILPDGIFKCISLSEKVLILI